MHESTTAIPDFQSIMLPLLRLTPQERPFSADSEGVPVEPSRRHAKRRGALRGGRCGTELRLNLVRCPQATASTTQATTAPAEAVRETSTLALVGCSGVPSRGRT